MPDKRKHRGPNPKDAELFSGDWLPILWTAVSELSWLLSRDYAIDSALKLVGDRHHLVKRQRIAVRRAAASDSAVARRRSSEASLGDVGELLVVDGFNVIVTVEAALSGGVLLRCRDGAIRDLASVHGSYRKVDETVSAIQLIAEALDNAEVRSVLWLLDSPVSNSGRLAEIIRVMASEDDRQWDVDLVHDVDRRLIDSPHPVATSDSNVLDGTSRWVNLGWEVVKRLQTDAWMVDLDTGG